MWREALLHSDAVSPDSSEVSGVGGAECTAEARGVGCTLLDAEGGRRMFEWRSAVERVCVGVAEGVRSG